ncbi:serine/threonine protein kinase regulatory subunit ATG13 [Saccharomyces cerevisiae S288C]|uniref:Autophagy-related protein 13 n=2 Tax=Saccharomyces cerevisiae TaxID=4932 RepID=ATG13_YEAST|nr:serine/threonine protein kinase regulatory subunit ATG13 [Saccharomyces cerevisiae S288C]Q06628.1 RecName: Full=Autophagy-related protein 13 [Saccharomyces cerevisiae S288C]AAB68118.1 Ypr185wp [Saccharomyces cerevisiae]KAJ1537828.1 serine/threonine protein kinase regulatory subunit [Saccharomyces cerevisiae]CAI4865048.1 ACA_G0057720.mRNA.1.CDS.1 [Saccharomyces cerevisiae]CAI6921020.1 ACA_G0057720.mRNA.1.CDS.1 [Saccharomyces cerevisiae]BAA21485.1 Apg13p [Saccharomyces cerevisiae]|eukprot:NP_015511.1 serine/threonine protein kinase regulatory subunit ATG13 [Saccharomyces cerevisiae S288C]
MVAEEDIEKQVLQLIDSFFLKTTLLICSTESSRYQSSTENIFLFDDTWFEDHSELVSELPEIISKWSHYDGRKELPPLVVETYLDLRQLNSSHLVRLKDHEGHLWNVCKGTKKQEIVMERWLIELDNSSPTFKSYSEDETDVNELSKQLVLLFRYLLTLIQLLPTTELYQLLIKSYNGPQNEGSSNPITSTGPLVSIRTCVLDGSKPILSKGRIGLSKPIINTYSNALNESNLPAHLDQKKITPVWTKFGLLRVSVSYRRDWKFEINNTNDELFSARHASVSHNSQGPQNQPEQEGQSDQDIGKRQPQFQQQQQPQQQQQQQQQQQRQHQVQTQQQRQIPDRRSLSLSPCTRANSFEPQSWQKKVYPISRPVQPFKVGSIGSQSASRNPSNSSFFNQPPVHRPSMSSNYGPQMNIEGTSVGSTSKYSSSFGNIRRHSSVKTTENAEKVSKAVKSPLQPQESQEDLMDFVKLLEEKPDLTIKKTSGNNPPNINISDSLIRYQNLKPSNDLLSEDLSVSLSMDPNHTYHRGRSDSHSPLPSISPSMHYGSLNSRMSQGANASHLIARGGGNSSTSALNSRRNSLDKSSNKQGMSGLPPIFGGESTSYHHDNKIQKYNQLGVEEDDDDENDRLLNQMGNSATKFKSSISPRSIDSISSSFIKSRIPIRQPYHYSQPTTAPFQAQAKFHKPANKLIDNGNRSNSNNNNHNGNDAVGVMHNDEDDQDDDLVFFMSDMNLSKEG